MAAEGGRQSAGLIAEILRRPEAFDFFQAVRLLDRATRARTGRDGAVGRDQAPSEESVRFRTERALGFPSSPLTKARPLGDEASFQQELTVAFMGLTGPNGALPQHYSQEVFERDRRKESSFHDLLDVFNHRLIAFFFRAWEKYRVGPARERAALGGRGDDPVTTTLLALVGRLGRCGDAGLDIEPDAFVYYGGCFADRRRPVAGLRRLLSDYFRGIEVGVLQFRGRWLGIAAADRSVLPRAGELGDSCGLGTGLVLGDRVWDVQSKIRIRVGPLAFERFRDMVPGAAGFRSLCQLVRSFVGAELDFDVQVVPRGEEIPGMRLGGAEAEPHQLGRTSWLASRPLEKDPEDVVFPAAS